MTWVARDFHGLCAGTGPRGDLRRLSSLIAHVTLAPQDLKDLMPQISVPRDKPSEATAYAALMHEADHLMRLIEQAERRGFVRVLEHDLVTQGPTG